MVLQRAARGTSERESNSTGTARTSETESVSLHARTSSTLANSGSSTTRSPGLEEARRLAMARCRTPRCRSAKDMRRRGTGNASCCPPVSVASSRTLSAHGGPSAGTTATRTARSSLLVRPPAARVTSPDRARASRVLPEPEGPMTPCTSPGSTAIEMLCSSGTPSAAAEVVSFSIRGMARS